MALFESELNNITDALLSENEKYLVIFYSEAMDPDPSETVCIFR